MKEGYNKFRRRLTIATYLSVMPMLALFLGAAIAPVGVQSVMHASDEWVQAYLLPFFFLLPFLSTQQVYDAFQLTFGGGALVTLYFGALAGALMEPFLRRILGMPAE